MKYTYICSQQFCNSSFLFFQMFLKGKIHVAEDFLFWYSRSLCIDYIVDFFPQSICNPFVGVVKGCSKSNKTHASPMLPLMEEQKGDIWCITMLCCRDTNVMHKKGVHIRIFPWIVRIELVLLSSPFDWNTTVTPSKRCQGLEGLMLIQQM